MRSVRTAQIGPEGYERWLPQALGLPAVCALLALSVHLAGGDLAILQRLGHARGQAVMPLRFALGGADGGSGQ